MALEMAGCDVPELLRRLSHAAVIMNAQIGGAQASLDAVGQFDDTSFISISICVILK